MTTGFEGMKGLLEDSSVTEIMVDAPDRVYVERDGRLEDTDVRFASEREIIKWVNGLLASDGWEPVGEGRRWVEARLRDGSYVSVILPPVAVSGPCVVIKKPLRELLTFDQLLQWGSINQSLLDFFKIVMKSRLNVLVSGGISSGKTTLARLLVDLVPPEERLVVVGLPELMRFLRIRHDRMVYLEAQTEVVHGPSGGGTNGDGEMDACQLLQRARRLRPDRIVYAELAGAEAAEVLRLMNTGHDGMMTTIHANNPRDALNRLETMVTLGEPGLTLPTIRAQIADAINLIVQQLRLEDGTRKVVSIAEVQGLKGNNVVLQELFTWEKTGVNADGRLSGVFKATGAVPSFVPTLALAGLTFPKGMFEAQG